VDAGVALDPNDAGSFAYSEFDATMNVAATSHTGVALHVAAPTASGSFPLVVIGHGFQLSPTQYYGYLKQLASHGYIALTVDFPTSLFSVNNPNNATDLLAGIDWALADSRLAGRIDTQRIGLSGHSLGGKVALLAATYDTRVKAVFTLDPVDSGGGTGCSPPNCVAVKALMPSLHIPTGFIGETLDSVSSSQACAPAADNYTTFYAGTNSPSLQVTALGANHMSFLDDTASCGLVCAFCNSATASNASVNAMARAFMVAFFERHLRGNTAYDTWLTGPQAQARYVATNKATITSR
jgi:dienelactone hydrolase